MAYYRVRRTGEQIQNGTELYHHGILGQKWGIRRFQNKDGTRTAAGKKRYGSRYESIKNEDHLKPDDEKENVKKLVRNMALHTVLLPIAPIYSIASISEDVKTIVGAAQAKSKIKRLEAMRSISKIDDKTGLLLKHKKMTQEEDLQYVNPEFKNFSSNTKNNCMLCTFTYDMRRRGFEVTAKKANTGYTTKDLLEFYPNAKVVNIGSRIKRGEDGKLAVMHPSDFSTKTVNELVKQGDGARGNLMVGWNSGGGHSVAYEVQHGSVRFLDGQSCKIYDEPSKLLNRVFFAQYARLDDNEPDYEKIKEACR